MKATKENNALLHAAIERVLKKTTPYVGEDEAKARWLREGLMREIWPLVTAPEGAVSMDEKNRRGDLLGTVLGVREDRTGYYKTAWGKKTSIGLFNTTQSIMETGGAA